MLVHKGVVIGGAFLLFLLGVSNFLLWSKVRSVREYPVLERETTKSSPRSYLRLRQIFEGRRIVDFDPSLRYYRSGLSSAANTIIFSVDSFGCAPCFEYHVDQIRQLYVDDKISLALYGVGRYTMLVKNALPFGTLLGQRSLIRQAMEAQALDAAGEFIVLLVNGAGQILYVDAADNSDYSKSEAFYTIVQSYLESARQRRKATGD